MYYKTIIYFLVLFYFVPETTSCEGLGVNPPSTCEENSLTLWNSLYLTTISTFKTVAFATSVVVGTGFCQILGLVSDNTDIGYPSNWVLGTFLLHFILGSLFSWWP